MNVSETSRVTLPFCTVVVPCKNEIRTIDDCLQSLLANAYPERQLEILVVDGGSTDGTRARLAEYVALHPCLRVIDNPGGVIPVSMNAGIRQARGEVIVKADAHTVYPDDYIVRCVTGLVESRAANVGGVIEVSADEPTVTGRTIAQVLMHPFGRGNSRFRIRSSGPIEADTVAWGCYPRRVLEDVGGYNELLRRSSDVDLNARIRRAGGRILLIPDIVIRYRYHHTTYRSFLIRNAVDGYWVTYPMRLGGQGMRMRHLAPVAALAAMSAQLLLSLRWPPVGWAAATFAALYTLGLAGASAQIGRRERSLGVALTTPVVIAGQHLAYALGSLWGLIRPVPPQVRAAAARSADRRSCLDPGHLQIRDAGPLTIVIPAFNEASRLPPAIEAIDGYLREAGAAYELIVVDDGSTDGTADAVERLAEGRSDLRLIRFSENRGKGAAVTAGMLAGSGRVLVFTDADQSTSIDQLPALLQPLVRGFDVAMGSRGLTGSAFVVRQRWYRRKLGDAFGVLARLLLVRGFRDCQCGFKAFSRQAARQIFTKITSPTAIFDVEVVLLSARLGLRVAEVPVTWKHDPDSRLVYNAHRAVGVLLELLRLRRHWRVIVPPRAAVTSVFDQDPGSMPSVAMPVTRTGAL